MLRKKLSKNIIIYGLSNGIQSLVPFIMLPILTSYISVDGYGLLSIIDTNILFLAPFILLNIDSGISVEFYKVDKKVLSLFIANGIILSLGSFFIVFILFFIFNSTLKDLFSIPSEILFLLPIFVILRLIPAIVLVLFQAQQKAIKYLTFSILQTVFDLSLSIFFVIYLKFGYLGRLGGAYSSFFLFTIIGIIILFKMGYINFTFSIQKIKEILKFGVPLIPHVIGGIIIIMSGRFFISYYAGNNFVGLYTVAYQVGAVVLLFSRSVNQAWSPMLFGLLKERKFDNVKQITKMLFVVFVLFSLIVYLFSDLLFDVLINKSYKGAKKYFPYLLLGFLFQSLYFLITDFFFYVKRTGLLSSVTVFGALLNLTLNYFLIKSYGVIGIAYSSAITWFFFLVGVFLIFKSKIYNYVFGIN